MNTLGRSMGILRRIRARKKRTLALMLVLSLVVSMDVFWILRQPGLTLAGDASCGILEHTHDGDCGIPVCICDIPENPHVHDDGCYQTITVEDQTTYRLICEETEVPHEHHENCFESIEQDGITETVLICDLQWETHEHNENCYEAELIPGYEEMVQICEISELSHIHDENCYQWEMTCTLEEHVHSIACYSDENADVETLLDWQGMFKHYPYTGNLNEDLVGIAKTQVGYTESLLNFEVDSDGIRRGYTRYGAWYGTPYRDWSAMFVSFCLNYAGADPEQAPGNTGAGAMAELWRKQGNYMPAGEYTPVPGDLVFFENHTVGIVTERNQATCCVVRGDVEDAVVNQVLSLQDPSIIGWGVTPTAASTKKTVVEETYNTEPTEEYEQPLPDEPVPETEQEIVAEEEEAVDLLDISNGPAVFIFSDGEPMPQMQTFSMRMTRTTTDLLSYLQANGGSYFFTLLDLNNKELPKDEQGNYIAQANAGYKLTISVVSPKGFLPGTYEYQIPNGLMVDGGQGNFILKDNTNVGSWTVTDTGLITLVFNENMNSRTDITISAAMGIHFPEQEDPLDFDGMITVKVEPPVQQQNPTVLTKWGIQGNLENNQLDPNNSEYHKTDVTKIYWTLRIDGHADSQIPGNILTDQSDASSWAKPHFYTESDMAAGISFGVSDPGGGWHSWRVYADDPYLIWTENGWSYKIPKTVTCDSCGELELGNDGWTYYINYTSTPVSMNAAGTFDYENKATVDGQTAWGWSNFTHGEIQAVINKAGSFVSDAGGGNFLWEIQVTIPGRVEGQRALYSWFIQDEMRLLDDNGWIIGRVQNDANLSQVTANFNGMTIQIPRIQDATDQDMFAWDNAWTGADDGISHTRTINLLSRCQCTPETCHWGGCSEYWFQYDDGTWDKKGFCQCWTETQNMTFTFVYKTTDLSVVEGYGTLGYKVNNHAQLFYMEDADTSVRVSYDDATVEIPNLFKKELIDDFDGYTANYKITVNEAKVVLTNGSPLYIHDVMTKTLAYISGSLIITAEDANGNVTTLKQGTDFTVTYDGSGNEKDEQGNAVHILDIVIEHPQPVMYTLDYDATLIMPEQVTSSIKYANSATITLWGQSITNNSTEKVYADINIAAKTYAVKMHKTSASTGEPLQNATFGLYNAQGGLITTGTTNIHGELLFQTSIVDGIILREHELYYMQEIKAPPGYRLDDTQYWFCFCNDESDNCETCNELMAGLDAFRIPFDQIGSVYMVNELLRYHLPATGGSGTYPIMLVSVIFIVAPLVIGFIRRRKQGRRGVA